MKPNEFVPVILLILILLAGSSCSCGGGGEVSTPTPGPTANAGPSATVTHTPVSGYMEYVDEENGFAVSYPQDWAAPPENQWPQGVLALFEASSACGNFTSKCGVDTSPLPVGSTIDVWVSGILQGFAGEAGYSYISHRATVVDGRDAAEHVYLWDVGGVTVHTLQLYVEGSSTVWVLSCGCDPACYDGYEAMFNAVVNSFRLVD